MEDIEGDFWKEVFMHSQHRNMCRVDAVRLTYADAKKTIEEFSKKHPELHPLVQDTGSYITWETPVTSTVSLRLFIQNQIKGTLLQNNNGEQVKIADAKFVNDPFPEVEAILENRENYERQISQSKTEALHSSMFLKVGGEFVKAYLMKKCGESKTDFSVEPGDDGKLKVVLKTASGEKSLIISPENFVEELKNEF